MRVVLLSMSAIDDDPRVRRQGDALAAAGHEVVAVGVDRPTRSPAPLWTVRKLPWPTLSRGERLGLAWGKAVVRLWPAHVHRVVREHPALASWYPAVRDLQADLYVANDWPVLPLAARLAEEHGARYAYDSHEYAVEEWPTLRWRLLNPPWIRAVERAFVPGAQWVMTVCDGIADLLQRDYALADRPLVVRNVPPYESCPYRAPGAVLRVLYHGGLLADRGLERLVDSVPLWAPDRELDLRVVGDSGYVAQLQERAARVAPGRIRFLEPAAMTDLVRLANEADIGIVVLSGESAQYRFSLPNKLFEYAMAGLALVVPELPEMAALVRRHELGVVLHEVSPEGIAAAVNGLSRDDVARGKRNALAAAGTLCWEREQEVLVAACAD